MPPQPTYQTRPFSPWRTIMSDGMKVANEKNYVYGLYSLDVTEARRIIHEYEARTGGDFSFTAFLIGCVGLAVDENKAVQAMRQGSRLIIFDDVDVNIQVERENNGSKTVAAHVIRGANHKTAQEIHDEIRAAQREKLDLSVPVPGAPRWTLLAARLPGFIRRMYMGHVLNDPFALRKMAGTVNLTAFGMAGKGGGWGIAIGEMSLNIAVGGIEPTVRAIDGQFCVREMLSLTLSFDHDVIDGAPAARFATRLRELIEAAHGLEALETQPPA